MLFQNTAWNISFCWKKTTPGRFCVTSCWTQLKFRSQNRAENPFSGGKRDGFCFSHTQEQSVLTWNSLMYCAMTNSCLSLAEGSAKISGRLLEAWDFFWEAVPLRWQSKPIFPGSWNLWSWGPKGPITSSGHTVLGPAKGLVSVSKSQKKKAGKPKGKPLSHTQVWSQTPAMHKVRKITLPNSDSTRI